MGYWNGKIGQREHGEEHIGLFGIGNRNEGGRRLVLFALQYRLKVANTFSKKRKCRKWTWLSPNEKTENEIDFFLVQETSKVRNVDIINNFEFESNHRAVRYTLAKFRRKKFKNYNEKERLLMPTYDQENFKKAVKEDQKTVIGSEAINESNLQRKYDEF